MWHWSKACGEVVEGVWPGIGGWVSVGVGWVDGIGGWTWTQMDAVNQATRLAMVQERAEPCRTPQRKFVVAVPKGVVVVMRRLLRDSAIHSM